MEAGFGQTATAPPSGEPYLPEAERELTQQTLQTAEQILRRNERERRARLTFVVLCGLGLLAVGPILALYAAFCVRLFEALA